MKKIAIYGGSFNPPTKAHLAIVEAVKPYVDEVWVIPVKAHAWNKELLPIDMRIEMLNMVFGNMENVKVMPIQKWKSVPQKTQPFMKYLKKKSLPTDYRIVIGSDNAEKIQDWFKWDELCKENKFIIIQREYEVRINDGLFDGSMMLVVQKCQESLSSSHIRACLKVQKFKEASRHSFKEVMRYIRENELYGYKKIKNRN